MNDFFISTQLKHAMTRKSLVGQITFDWDNYTIIFWSVDNLNTRVDIWEFKSLSDFCDGRIELKPQMSN